MHPVDRAMSIDLQQAENFFVCGDKFQSREGAGRAIRDTDSRSR